MINEILGVRPLGDGRGSTCIFAEQGISIVSFISPYREMRERARKQIETFVEIYVRCPIEVCEKRDVKGHYKKARNGEKGFESFLGISLPFEEPKGANIILNTSKETAEESTKKLAGFLKKKGVINS